MPCQRYISFNLTSSRHCPNILWPAKVSSTVNANQTRSLQVQRLENPSVTSGEPASRKRLKVPSFIFVQCELAPHAARILQLGSRGGGGGFAHESCQGAARDIVSYFLRNHFVRHSRRIQLLYWHLLLARRIVS